MYLWHIDRLKLALAGHPPSHDRLRRFLYLDQALLCLLAMGILGLDFAAQLAVPAQWYLLLLAGVELLSGLLRGPGGKETTIVDSLVAIRAVLRIKFLILGLALAGLAVVFETRLSGALTASLPWADVLIAAALPLFVYRLWCHSEDLGHLRASGCAGTLAADGATPVAEALVIACAAAAVTFGLPLSKLSLLHGPLPRFEAEACWFENKTNRQADCGFLHVAETRDSAFSGLIRLPVVIFRGPSAGRQPDPVVLLTGGPGGSAYISPDMAWRWTEWLDHLPWLGDRDLILVDQRGAGWSEPSLACDSDNDVLADHHDFDRQYAAARTCRRMLEARGIALAAYSTAAIAADIDDLRRTLGIEAWNLWGQSYGSRVAFEVMRRHPQAVRSAILDGVLPPDANWALPWAAGVNRVLDRLFTACAADPPCARAYPNLGARFQALVRRLRQAPATLAVSLSRTGETYRILLDDAMLVDAVIDTLYVSSDAARLPMVLDAASAGDFTALEALIDAMDWHRRGPGLVQAQNWTVSCRESSPRDGRVRRRAADSTEGWSEWWSKASSCGPWDLGLPPSVPAAPLVSDVPVLLLSGALDPVTPVEPAADAARSLTRGYHLVFPANAHDVSENRCAQRLMHRFLSDPSQAPADPCLAAERPLRFLVPDSPPEQTQSISAERE